MMNYIAFSEEARTELKSHEQGGRKTPKFEQFLRRQFIVPLDPHLGARLEEAGSSVDQETLAHLRGAVANVAALASEHDMTAELLQGNYERRMEEAPRQRKLRETHLALIEAIVEIVTA